MRRISSFFAVLSARCKAFFLSGSTVILASFLLSKPFIMSFMISRGSSVLGLSEVTKIRSARFCATFAIRGRFVLSRSPPQPKTTISLFLQSGFSVSRTFFRASSVCA